MSKHILEGLCPKNGFTGFRRVKNGEIIAVNFLQVRLNLVGSQPFKQLASQSGSAV